MYDSLQRLLSTIFFLKQGQNFRGTLWFFCLGCSYPNDAEIPPGAKICQRKACLASIDHFSKWSFCVFTLVAHRVAIPSLCCEKKKAFSISLGLRVTPFCACAPKNRLTHFTTDVFCRKVSVFKNGVMQLHTTSILTDVLFHLQSPQSLTGGVTPDRSDSPLCHFGSLRWGFWTQSNLHNEWTKVSLNIWHEINPAFPPK